MKKLNDILKHLGKHQLFGNAETSILGITMDSRQVQTGFFFAAVKGTQQDGHQYIEKAIEQGATAILCSELPENRVSSVSYVLVNEVSAALGKAADAFYDFPSSKLKLVGITGTNGKTSIATLLFNLFTELGYVCGLLSTVENKIGAHVVPSTHTTPDSVALNKLLADMCNHACEYVFMEVSSHAVHQNRIAGLQFTGGVFTNLTHDHLDYHETFLNYLNAKKAFFDQLPSTAFALSNVDDKNGLVMLQNTQAKAYTFGIKSAADFNARVVECSLLGIELSIHNKNVFSGLVGEFNASNLLAVYATAILLNAEENETLRVLSGLKPPRGRFDTFKSKQDGIILIVDYAHTPDALEKVCETVVKVKKDSQQLFVIVGCGGNRDKSKRPLMAAVACELGNKAILTSDNPRDENPADILIDMQEGLNPLLRKKAIVIEDRKEAIKAACSFAQREDIILIAGKGHETYQEIKGVKYPFDDKQIAVEFLNQLNR